MVNPPRLERLLLDADVRPDIETQLRVLGFRTESVLRVAEIDETDDISVVRWARKRRMIVVCFDQHDDHQTKLAWNPEIGLRGGRVLQISGNPGQEAEVAAGKMLIHRPTWRPFLATGQHGVVRLMYGTIRTFTQQQLLDAVPTPRNEVDWEIYFRALGKTPRRGGRPGKGGRRRFPQQVGKRLV